MRSNLLTIITLSAFLFIGCQNQGVSIDQVSSTFTAEQPGEYPATQSTTTTSGPVSSTFTAEQPGEYPAPQSATTSPGPEMAASYPTPEPFVFPSSKPGGITIHGTLIIKSLMMMTPGLDDAIFLVPLSTDEQIGTIPPFTVGEVPQATVDERTFEYLFADIEPGMYAIVVLTKDGIQTPAKYFENGNLAIITLEESDRDEMVEVENITVP